MEGPIQARPSPKSVPPGSPPRSPPQDPALGALGRGLASGLPSGPPFPAQSTAGLVLRGGVLPGGGALGAAGSPVLLHLGVRWAHWQPHFHEEKNSDFKQPTHDSALRSRRVHQLRNPSD